MNPTTLFYLLPQEILPSILNHLDSGTRIAVLCLVYYGDKLELWYKWYPLSIK